MCWRSGQARLRQVVRRTRPLQGRPVWIEAAEVDLDYHNIPGPRDTLQLGGARLIHAYPAAPIAGNVTLVVGVLSYAGELGLGLVADADAWPDLPVLVDAVRKLFEELIRST
jgi:hypothetical protein